MWVVILIFLLLYWLLYSPYDFPFGKYLTVSKTIDEEEDSPDQFLSSLSPSSSRPPPPHSYFFGQTDSQQGLTVSASYGGSWTFGIGDRYTFDARRYQISESDECFGKPKGFKLRVRGKTLYDTVRKKKLVDPSFSTTPRDLIAYDTLEYFRRGYDFYFMCDQDTVRQLYACPPGTSFRDDDCHAIDSCADRENGSIFPDATDRHYYRVCLDEKPVRKRCQPETFFWMDACRPLVSDERTPSTLISEMCESEHFILPINKKKYIRCVLDGEENNGRPKYRGVVEECSENTSILGSWKSCERDDCVGIPDEFRKPMAAVTRGPFVYSPGYYVCRGNRIVETVACPAEWNPGTSLGDDLTRLPAVFDANKQACSVPSFCENVFSSKPNSEVVVPVHEFTKHVPKWKYAAFFDSAAGYRCAPEGRTRFVTEPGKRIIGNAVTSACGQDSRTKIPIGDRIDAYYDCESQKVITCGPDLIFDGERCKKPIKRAHSYKNMPFFRLTGLSHRNDWMEPFPSRSNSSTCLQEQEGVTYFSQYDVCLVPECSAYPFLKQLPRGLFFFLPDGKHTCAYNAATNTITRKRHFFGPNRKLDFWNQRSVPRTDVVSDDDCPFGQNLKSGNFFLDSTMYVTCNSKQPFVFCPSASTRGIALAPYHTYACLSHDSAYEVHIEANETISCLTEQVEYFQIEEESQYLVNGKNELGSENRNPSSGMRNVFVLASDEKFTFWSDCPYVVLYRKLPTYPPDVHLEKNALASGMFSSSNNWLIPVELPNHIVEESIEKEFY